MALTRLQNHQLQPNAVVTTVTAASQAIMLALDAQTDDFCIRTDVKKTFVLTGSDPTNLAHWQEVYTIDQANVAITGGSISGTTIEGNSAGTSFGTSATTLDSFLKTSYRTAKYVVSVANGADFQSAEMCVTHNDTTSYITTYGIITTTGNSFVTFSTTISGNDVLLQATGAATGNVAKVQKIYIAV
jgi:hypothetical protein